MLVLLIGPPWVHTYILLCDILLVGLQLWTTISFWVMPFIMAMTHLLQRFVRGQTINSILLWWWCNNKQQLRGHVVVAILAGMLLRLWFGSKSVRQVAGRHRQTNAVAIACKLWPHAASVSKLSFLHIHTYILQNDRMNVCQQTKRFITNWMSFLISGLHSTPICISAFVFLRKSLTCSGRKKLHAFRDSSFFPCPLYLLAKIVLSSKLDFSWTFIIFWFAEVLLLFVYLGSILVGNHTHFGCLSISHFLVWHLQLSCYVQWVKGWWLSVVVLRQQHSFDWRNLCPAASTKVGIPITKLMPNVRVVPNLWSGTQ